VQRMVIAWHLIREFEIVAQGYADCAVTARTETLTSTSQFAVQRVSKWFKNPFYDEQLSFLLKILKQQTLQALPSSDAVCSIFISALQDKNGYVRKAAAESLGQLDNNSNKVIDALLLRLQDEYYGVRRLAASSLGQLGNNSDKVIEALLLRLQDEHYGVVRRAAADSLGQLGNNEE
jgi:hypothetical protein